MVDVPDMTVVDVEVGVAVHMSPWEDVSQKARASHEGLTEQNVEP